MVYLVSNGTTRSAPRQYGSLNSVHPSTDLDTDYLNLGSPFSNKGDESLCSSLELAQRQDLDDPGMISYPDIPDYKLIQEIGEGAFSVVYKAVHIPSQYVVALKIVSKARLDAKQHDNINREAALMERMKHPNLVKMLDFMDTPSNYVIVLEYMSGGELYTTLVNQVCFPEDVCRNIIRQVALALRYLHEECGIVHRDIKLENILFKPAKGYEDKISILNKSTSTDEQIEADPNAGRFIGLVKIADFGLSKVIFNASTLTPCGTVGYTAPEILREGRYSKGVDIWALGCVLYTMLCGFPPFFDDSPKGLMEKVSEGKYVFLSPWWDHISLESKDLITHLLDVNPENRYTLDQCLNHPWMVRDILSSNSRLPTSVSLENPFEVNMASHESCFREGGSIATHMSLYPGQSLASIEDGSARTSSSSSIPIGGELDSKQDKHLDMEIDQPSKGDQKFSTREELTPLELYTENLPRDTRTRYRPPFGVYCKDFVDAPLKVYHGINADTVSSVQFVRVYSGGGAVSMSKNTAPYLSLERSVSQSQLDVSTEQAHESIYTKDLKSCEGSEIVENIKLMADLESIDESSKVRATELKVYHGLKRDVMNFKLDMEISPLYNRRRRARVALAS